MALKDAFGEPKQGFHAARLCGFARNDILATIVASYPLSWYLGTNYVYTLLGFFVLGEALHYALGVQTTFIRWLTA
jgi:hypothetical protein